MNKIDRRKPRGSSYNHCIILKTCLLLILSSHNRISVIIFRCLWWLLRFKWPSALQNIFIRKNACVLCTTMNFIRYKLWYIHIRINPPDAHAFTTSTTLIVSTRYNVRRVSVQVHSTNRQFGAVVTG